MSGLGVHRDIIEVPAERRACRSHRVTTAGTAEIMREDGLATEVYEGDTHPLATLSPQRSPGHSWLSWSHHLALPHKCNRQNNGHVSRSGDIIFSNGCVLESFSFAVKFQWFCSVVFVCVFQTLVLCVLYFSLPQRLPYLDTHRDGNRNTVATLTMIRLSLALTAPARQGRLPFLQLLVCP